MSDINRPIEQKTRLRKIACCGRQLGWVADGISVFCPRCGKRVFATDIKIPEWTGVDIARQFREGAGICLKSK